MKKQLLNGAILATFLACGGVKSTEYQGPPLATIRGSMNGLSSATGGSPISLAIAWYPYPFNILPDQPPAIVSSSLTYTGVFPISWTFDLYAPPPPETMTPMIYNGLSYKEAIGVVIAYRDNNGNGRLDPIATNGSAVDTLLGASVPNAVNLNGSLEGFASGFLVAYIEGDTGGQLSPGYHVLRNNQDVDLATSVPIEVTGAPDLDLLVCGQLFQYPQVLAQAGTACAVAPTNAQLHVWAAVYGKEENSWSVFSLSDGVHMLADATVTLNGVRVPFDGDFNQYLGRDGEAGIEIIRGSNTFTVTQALGSAAGAVSVPDAISVLAPAAGATVDSQNPLSVTWAQVPQATRYHVLFWQGDGKLVYQNHTPETSLTIPSPGFAGEAILSVEAEGSIWNGTPTQFAAGYSSVTRRIQLQ